MQAAGGAARERPAPGEWPSRATTVLAWVVAAALTALCVLGWKLSLAWPLTRDLPIMLYVAMLWETYGVLPHAGFFDMNLLGSYVSYAAIGRLFGYDPAAVRHADLAFFLALTGVTLATLRHAGWLTGWIAAALFGAAYLQYGPDMSLQREYLMLLPLTAAAAAATAAGPGRTRGPALLAGLAIGAAMTIKPQAGVAAAPIGAFLAAERGRSPAAAASAIGWMAVGIACVLAALVATLSLLGVLGAFLDIATGYLPLYGDMNGRHEIFEPGTRLAYTVEQWVRLGGHGAWAVAAAIGAGAYAAALPRQDAGRRRAALFAGLAATFAVYPVLSGKFWDYHWLPMVYWLAVCASLALARVQGDRLRSLRLSAAAALVALVLYAFPPNAQLGGLLAEHPARNATAEELAAFLTKRLLPGETVQPMDWTKGGVVHALLRARVEPATSFVYDFHFYHHVSHPYIRSLRARFLTELEAARPRFIVKSRFGPFPSGPDADRSFPAFQRILRADYRQVADTLAYTIYERR